MISQKLERLKSVRYVVAAMAISALLLPAMGLASMIVSPERETVSRTIECGGKSGGYSYTETFDVNNINTRGVDLELVTPWGSDTARPATPAEAAIFDDIAILYDVATLCPGQTVILEYLDRASYLAAIADGENKPPLYELPRKKVFLTLGADGFTVQKD